MSVKSHGHHRFYVTFIDDYSRKVTVYPLKSKGEVFSKFVEFKERAENETEQRIKIFRSDNGTEYENANFHEYFAKHGIKHEKSAPYSPQQNGLAERMNRTIIEKVRCMLLDAHLSKQFWCEAVLAAVNIINAIPTGSNEKSPNELWHKKEQNMKLFKVFGCRAMVWQPQQKRKKLDAKSFPCILLRYADDAKAYRLYDVNAGKIVISRDVVFFENENTAGDPKVLENKRNFVERVTIDEESDIVDINLMEEVESNEANDSGRNDEIESTASNNIEPAIADEESVVPKTSVNNNNESIVASDTSQYEDTEDTIVDDGETNTSSIDPTFKTRAKITGDNRVKTRAMVRNDELLNLHVAFIVGEPVSYSDALKDDKCNL